MVFDFNFYCVTVKTVYMTYTHQLFRQSNLVLSTGLIMCIGHRKAIRKLTFRALALRRSESRNCGLCVVYIQKDGATLLVGAW